MLFNSLSFAIFLPIVFLLYWFVARKKREQDLLLLFASYYFYACWDYRFLFLLMFSTFLDYFTGLQVSDSNKESTRKFWFWLSIIVNLGFLCVFKYFNFFADSFANALGVAGITVNPLSLSVILPVGISFYTFHGLSYVIDIYNRRIIPERNFVDYSLFVSFFPLLVAGPIERATHLLPQIQQPRHFVAANATDGLRQILWGVFKKVVIADNCSPLVNSVFESGSEQDGSTLLMAAILFTFQIYCDFSGYSDIALGVARLFGFELLRNFAFPYFSRDIAEFWRRWHISLSSWFRDYLYIPLGGSKGNKLSQIRNTFIIFIVSGFWHGANWTFVFWGFLNALYFLPLLLLKQNRNNTGVASPGRFFPTTKEFVSMTFTFALVVIAWIFFRSKSIAGAFSFLGGIFSKTLFTKPGILPIPVLALIILLLLTEWVQRDKQHALEFKNIKIPTLYRWGIYTTLTLIIILFGASQQEFIYFQF